VAAFLGRKLALGMPICSGKILMAVQPGNWYTIAQFVRPF
jgi:hypothetical protein